MPELPDITIYLEALEKRIRGARLDRIRLASPFLLRTTDPPLTAAHGRSVSHLSRMGKRMVLALAPVREGTGLDAELFLVIHLMIAGRLHWKAAGAGLPGRRGLAAFDFSSGTLLLTEAGATHRASLHLVQGATALAALDPRGLEVLDASPEAFRAALTRENHTLKRALTDPRLFSGIGNAYSDEILHAARLSPLTLTRRLTDVEVDRLFHVVRQTLREWLDRLREETGDEFPEKVTAFRPSMAVHGRHGKPCPVCGERVQRIRYAANEANYCARCQTGGKLLADRALSRLLKDDWPRSLEDWEEHFAARSDARPPAPGTR